MPKEKTLKEKAPKEKAPKEKTVKLTGYLVFEPDRVLLEKVAGKIGEYEVMVGWRETCGSAACGPIAEFDDKVEKLNDLVKPKFGEIFKILAALQKPK
jgi:hypothetical protein